MSPGSSALALGHPLILRRRRPVSVGDQLATHRYCISLTTSFTDLRLGLLPRWTRRILACVWVVARRRRCDGSGKLGWLDAPPLLDEQLGVLEGEVLLGHRRWSRKGGLDVGRDAFRGARRGGAAPVGAGARGEVDLEEIHTQPLPGIRDLAAEATFVCSVERLQRDEPSDFAREEERLGSLSGDALIAEGEGTVGFGCC